MKRGADDCPISKVVGLFGDSCSILIVRDLLEGPKRYSELECSLNASSRTLVKKLKLLEHEGLINRKKLSGTSGYGKYQLTKKGAAFQKVADAMRAYGKKYL
ncbi:MAG: helix-turn-helix domain-containing protein [Patescibacteria group bacterium]